MELPLSPSTDIATERLPFADLAAAGQNAWWRYLVAILAIVVLYLVVSLAIGIVLAIAPAGLAQVLTVGDRQAWLALSDGAALALFALIMMSIAIMLPITGLAVHLVHRRTWQTLVTAAPRFRWGDFLVSFGVAVGLMILQLMVYAVFAPEAVTPSFDAGRFMFFLPFVLLLVPFQVMAEEVLFRGYVLQGVAHFTRIFALRLLTPAALFAAVHLLNAEVEAGGLWAVLDYVVIALYFTYLALRGDGIELPFGLHLGINLSFATIVGYGSSSLMAPTLFYIAEPDFRFGSLGTLMMCGLHYLVVFKLLRR